MTKAKYECKYVEKAVVIGKTNFLFTTAYLQQLIALLVTLRAFTQERKKLSPVMTWVFLNKAEMLSSL